MNIGIILRYGFKPETGGGFSYYDALLGSLLRFESSHNIKFVFFNPGKNYIDEEHRIVPLGIVEDRGIMGRTLAKNNTFVKLCFHFKARFYKRSYEKIIKGHDVKLVYYINQDDFVLPDIPFVMTVWDMGFKVTYPFPELVRGRNFHGRNLLFSDTLQRALMIFAESEAGKRDLIKYANIYDPKIKVLPIFAGNVINENVDNNTMASLLGELNLQKDKFFFYPAQFWAHKNHVTILKAFDGFVKEHPEFKLVFTGGDKSNLDYVYDYCKKLGISDSTYFLGYVSRQVLFTLYKNATALVMASFFGETNMPPIEAMNIGCPVVCSDIDGHREILDDAALYFDAWDWRTLNKAFNAVIGHEDEFRSKVLNQSLFSKFTINQTIHLLDEYLYEASQIRETWK